MTLREKYCKHCQKYFFYEDGIDAPGVGLTRKDNPLKSPARKVVGFCPICVDPHAILGMTYKKSTILYTFKKHLHSKGIDVSVLDDENLSSMLKEFPRANSIYTGGTYNTFTLLPGITFSGKYGEFIMGGSVKKIYRGKGQQVRYREIRCARCTLPAYYKTRLVLEFYLGLKLKICKSCDWRVNSGIVTQKKKEQPVVVEHKPRNTNGLNRHGSRAREFSSRTLAKALNVSKNDFLRHRITKPEPPLPNDTIVNGLRIEESYWCKKTCAPRYRLVCDDCQGEFDILQKRVRCIQHFCPVRMKK